MREGEEVILSMLFRNASTSTMGTDEENRVMYPY
jgi:hypothetical protein